MKIVLAVLAGLAFGAVGVWASFPAAPDPCGGRFKVGEEVYYTDALSPARVLARDCRHMTYKIVLDGLTINDVGEEDLGRDPP